MNHSTLTSTIQLLRPHHYVKNIFIFAPAIFAFRFNLALWLTLGGIFVFFSLMASAAYIMNDIWDVAEDRQHPLKKERPIASGQIRVKNAIILAVLLFIFSATGSFLVSKKFFFIVISYFILNILYSIKLKHIPIVDLFIIAAGFILRIFAGSITVDIYLSKWIILNTFMLTLLIGFAKRREDILLAGLGHNTRKNINEYNLEFLTFAVSVLSGLTIIVYILFTVSNDVIGRFQSQNLYLTSFWVILGIFRFLKIILVNQRTSDPVEILYQDHWLKGIIFMWLVTFLGIVKLGI